MVDLTDSLSMSKSFVVKSSNTKTKCLIDIRYIVPLQNSLAGNIFWSAYEKKNGVKSKIKGRCSRVLAVIFVEVRQCE
jgi:hypothetical protein